MTQTKFTSLSTPSYVTIIENAPEAVVRDIYIYLREKFENKEDEIHTEVKKELNEADQVLNIIKHYGK